MIFWDVIDAKTRFLLATHITTTRGTKDARTLMEKAAKCAGKAPKIVVTDKLAAYLDGIELAFGADTSHRQGGPFEIQSNTNLIERFHGTLKARTKVMRALKNRDTLAQLPQFEVGNIFITFFLGSNGRELWWSPNAAAG